MISYWRILSYSICKFRQYHTFGHISTKKNSTNNLMDFGATSNLLGWRLTNLIGGIFIRWCRPLMEPHHSLTEPITRVRASIHAWTEAFHMRIPPCWHLSSIFDRFRMNMSCNWTKSSVPMVSGYGELIQVPHCMLCPNLMRTGDQQQLRDADRWLSLWFFVLRICFLSDFLCYVCIFWLVIFHNVLCDISHTNGLILNIYILKISLSFLIIKFNTNSKWDLTGLK